MSHSYIVHCATASPLGDPLVGDADTAFVLETVSRSKVHVEMQEGVG